MQVTVLASGSAGNAVLVEAERTRIMVDAGLPPRTLRRRLREAQIPSPRYLDAVVIIHAHGDHARHAAAVARSFNARLLVTEPIAAAWHLQDGDSLDLYAPGDRLPLDELSIEALAVPHDTPQVALFFDHDGERLALVTDLGGVPGDVRERLAGCSTVLIEANHDLTMLERGPYPPQLKERVAGGLGHLSNAQAAELLASLPTSLRNVVLMHLSETNNAPELALRAVRRALRGRGVRVAAASQRVPLRVGHQQLELPSE